MSTNDITGDAMRTRPASAAYRDNFDAIFRKEDQIEGWPMIDTQEVPELLEWPEDEERIDIIGQNGNDGLVYGELEQYK